MSSGVARAWLSLVSIVLVLWGIVFAFFGLKILPVARVVLLDWESAIYGTIMMGWGVTLLLVGRIALTRRDRQLTRALLIGVTVWLLAEATFSLRYAVWFNIGVDVGVFVLFSVPLLSGVRSKHPSDSGRSDKEKKRSSGIPGKRSVRSPRKADRGS